jgi:type IV secretion system protein VirB8
MNAITKGFRPFTARHVEGEEAADALMAQIESFEGDKLAEKERINRRLWKALGISLVVIGLQGAGNGMLAKFQHFIPIVMVEHEGAGNVTRQYSQDGDGITDAAAINRMNATTYVTSREHYYPGLWATDFKTVSLLSSPEEQKRLALIYAKDSPADPRTVYGTKGEVRIDRSPLMSSNNSVMKPALLSAAKDEAKAGVMQVFFYRSDSTDGENFSKPEEWVATFHFERRPGAKISDDAVAVNPFGWVVTEYESHRM